MSEIDLRDAAAFVDGMRGKIVEGAIAGLRSAGHRGVQKIVSDIIPSRSPQPVDRGLFRAGWRCRDEPDGASIENTEPHAAVIEHGARAENVKPGQKMRLALLEWIVRKGIAKGADAIEASWSIMRAMTRRGIFAGGNGLNILGQLVEQFLPDFVREEVAREIERRL